MPRRPRKTVPSVLAASSHTLSDSAKAEILDALGLEERDAGEALAEIQTHLGSYAALAEAESCVLTRKDYSRELKSIRCKLVGYTKNLRAYPDWLLESIERFGGNPTHTFRKMDSLLDAIELAEDHYKKGPTGARSTTTARVLIIKKLLKIFSKYSIPHGDSKIENSRVKMHAEREFVRTCLKDANIPCPGNVSLQRLIYETRNIPPRRYRKKRSKLG